MQSIDESVLLAVSGGCRELAAELLDTFLEELPGEWAELTHAVRAVDARRIREAAHRLSSSLGLIGAQRAAEVTRRLELVAAAGRVDAIATDWEELRARMEELRPLLTQWRHRLVAPDSPGD